jgi:GT2 family glycosyltransferase
MTISSQISDSLDVGVVTVSYYSETEINGLLKSLEQGQRKRNFKVVVISNSGSFQGITPTENTWLLEAPGNIGFGRGCNLGASQLNSRYLLFANPDVRITGDAVAMLVHLLKNNPDCGIISPYLSTDKMIFEPTGRLIDSGIGNPEKDMNGACFLIGKDLFKQLGGFDENFFMWMEDYDIFKRVVEQGKRIVFAEGVVAIHKFSHSHRDAGTKLRAYLTRVDICSFCYFAIKHAGILEALRWLLKTFIYYLYQLLRSLLKSATAKPRPISLIYVTFVLTLLFNSYRLKNFVSFDGKSYPWNRS